MLEAIVGKIINFFKGIGIFILLYIVVSGNGDSTFFGWIIMFLCIILTRMYLNPEIKKGTLAVITVVLAMLCAPGYHVAFTGGIVLTILFALYYFFLCDSDMDLLKRKIEHIMYVDKENEIEHKQTAEVKTEWSAINLKHPFTAYSYDADREKFRVAKGFFIFGGQALDVQLTALALTKYESTQNQVIFWTLEIPYIHGVKGHDGDSLKIENISKKRFNELLGILGL